MSCGEGNGYVSAYSVHVALFLMKLQSVFFGQIQILCDLTHASPMNNSACFNHYQADQLGAGVKQEK